MYFISEKPLAVSKPILSSEQLQCIVEENRLYDSHLPLSVQVIVTAIFHDKVLSHEGAKRSNPSLYAQYQDWIAHNGDNIKAQGESSLAAAKRITSNEWILTSPVVRNGFISNLLRTVPPSLRIAEKEYWLDEDIYENLKVGSVPGAPFRSTNRIRSLSMLNWDKSREELISSISSPSYNVTLHFLLHSAKTERNNVLKSDWVYRIDDTEMFVPNRANENFFEVL